MRPGPEQCNRSPSTPATASDIAAAQVAASDNTELMISHETNCAQPSHAAGPLAEACPQAGDVASRAGQMPMACPTESVDLSRPHIHGTAQLQHAPPEVSLSGSVGGSSYTSAQPQDHPAALLDTQAETTTAAAVVVDNLTELQSADKSKQQPSCMPAAVQAGTEQASVPVPMQHSSNQPTSQLAGASATAVSRQQSKATAASAGAAQSTAEMLQWLDAALAAKKPAVSKVRPSAWWSCRPPLTLCLLDPQDVAS